MGKILVSGWELPMLKLTGSPFKFDEDDKLFWVSYEFVGNEFLLDKLRLLDNGRSLEVKKNRRQETGRLLFQFKGIPEKALVPGLKLFPADWPLKWEKRAYFVPLGAGNKKLVPGHARLFSRLLDDRGLEVDFKVLPGPGEKYLVQAVSKRSFPCLKGQAYRMVCENGVELELALVREGSLESRDLNDLVGKTFRFPGNPTVNAIYSINLRLSGSVELPPPLWAEEFEESHGELGVRIMTKALDFFMKKAKNAAAQPGGISVDDLKVKMNLAETVFQFVIFRLIQQGTLRRKGEFLLPVGDPSAFLSPLAKNLLEKVEKAGVPGLDTSEEKKEALRVAYAALARMDLIVLTEEHWAYSRSAYEQIVARLCSPGCLGKTYRIAEVKDLLGCSRRQMLGLFQRMEADGWLVWKEDVREVVKEWTTA